MSFMVILNMFRIGRKTTILISLYGCSISSVLCAGVGGYHVILVMFTRALVGLFVGLNRSVVCVWAAERASTEEIRGKILLGSSILYTFGGVWVPCLAYFSLEQIGWRVFIVLSSVPFFAATIFIVHCFDLEQLGQEKEAKEQNGTTLSEETDSTTKNLKVARDTADEMTDFKTRLCKMALWKGTSFYQGWGTILLVPALIQVFNLNNLKETAASTGRCETVAKNWEFLLLALVNGAANLGRVFAHFIRDWANFRLVYCFLAMLTMGSYTATYLNTTKIAVIVSTNFAIKFAYGAATMENMNITYNVKYFGERYFALGCGLVSGAGVMAGVTGIVMAAFVNPSTAVLVSLAVSTLQLAVLVTMYEPGQMIRSDTSVQ